MIEVNTMADMALVEPKVYETAPYTLTTNAFRLIPGEGMNDTSLTVMVQPAGATKFRPAFSWPNPLEHEPLMAAGDVIKVMAVITGDDARAESDFVLTELSV